MFLTVGDRVKECRKNYELKQAAFESYGITQYHLSLIENNKRNVSKEMGECIYEAFVQLSEGEILKHYTKESFLATQTDQLTAYVDMILKQPKEEIDYPDLIELVKSFQATELLCQIYFSLGVSQREEKLLKDSNESFQMAIHYALATQSDLQEAEEYIANNLVDMGNYEGAILVYIRLATQSEYRSIKYFELKYKIAKLETLLTNYEDALEIMNDILENCPFDQLIIQATLMQSRVLRHLKRYDEVIEVGLGCIDDERYKDYLFYVNRNMSLVYQEVKNYELAIKFMQEALTYTSKTLVQVEHGRAALADIYIDAGELDNAKKELDLITPLVTQKQDYTLAQLTYTAYLRMYKQERNMDKIKEFLEELKYLVEKDYIKEDVYYKLKTDSLQFIFETQLNKL